MADTGVPSYPRSANSTVPAASSASRVRSGSRRRRGLVEWGTAVRALLTIRLIDTVRLVPGPRKPGFALAGLDDRSGPKRAEPRGGPGAAALLYPDFTPPLVSLRPGEKREFDLEFLTLTGPKIQEAKIQEAKRQEIVVIEATPER